MRREQWMVLGLSALLAACGATGGGVKPRAQLTKQQQAAELQVQLGQGYIEQGRLDVALEKLLRALELDPSSADGHMVIAVLYERIDQAEKAEHHYRRSIALRPESGMMANNYAVFLCRQGRYEDAQPQFQRVLKDPFYKTPAQALSNAGQCAKAAGRMADAEAHFRDALKRDPRNAGVLYELAELSQSRGDAMRARAFLQRHEAVAPAAPQALLLGLRIEQALGDTAAANDYRARLLREFPDSPAAREADGTANP